MNIMNQLTLRHMKSNKGRTIVTILGVMVSVAMITAVFISVASFLNLYVELGYTSDGNWEMELDGISEETVQKLREDARIETVGCTGTETEGASFRLSQRVSERTGIGTVYAGDEENLRQMILSSYDGELPRDDTEIAVEEELLQKNDLDWKIGDTVEVPLGNRYRDQGEGPELLLGTSWSSEETWEETEVKSFQITAILHDNTPTKMYSIIRGLSEEEKQGVVNADITLKEVNAHSLDTIKEIAQEYNDGAYFTNTMVLEGNFAVSKDNMIYTTLLPMALILLAIIIVASVMLIYNAFGMSLSERVRYLGMLASVGATKKQKRRSVYFEAFILGVIGIPLGIVSGILGISITLHIVGDKLLQSGLLNVSEEAGLTMRTVVPVWCIVGIVLFSTLTLFISAFIPARKASAITPIDAIRQTSELKVSAKKLRTPLYVYLLFGYEGQLAHKNMKRNGRKARMITASIALSMILFFTVNYFCELFMQSNSMQDEQPYQVEVSVDYADKDTIQKEIQELSQVDRCYAAEYYVYCYNSPEYPDLNQDFANPEFLTGTYDSFFDSPFILYVSIVEDEDFRQLLAANGLAGSQDVENTYFGESVRGVLLNNISHKEGGADVFRDTIIGQKLYYDQNSPEVPEIEIAGLVEYDDSNYLCKLTPKNCVMVIAPQSTFYRVLQTQYPEETFTIRLAVETEQHEKVTDEIYDLMERSNYTVHYGMDRLEYMQSMNTWIFVLEVFVYGFITLITLITVANIINTISTGIALRRKEFAMLKSVGITPKGFYKMICMESLFYGIKATVIGIPVSLLISYSLNRIMASAAIPFEVNVSLYLTVIVVVFAIIGMTMLYAVSKLRKNSIVETLKEEIS